MAFELLAYGTGKRYGIFIERLSTLVRLQIEFEHGKETIVKQIFLTIEDAQKLSETLRKLVEYQELRLH